MKYKRFEAFALAFGALAIAASVLMVPGMNPQGAEVAAQLLLIIVVAGALHWGRNGGFLAALLAIMIYVVMRFPLLQSEGLSDDMLRILSTRAITYGLVGVVGGELAVRVKYLFTRLENDSMIDARTGVYSSRYAHEAITSGLGQWERYRTQYSIIRVDFPASLFAPLPVKRERQLLRQLAAHARGDIRVADDVAFLPPRSLLVLLPGTDTAGAEVTSRRLAAGLAEVAHADAETVTPTIASAESSPQKIRALLDALARGMDEPGATGDPDPAVGSSEPDSVTDQAPTA